MTEPVGRFARFKNPGSGMLNRLPYSFWIPVLVGVAVGLLYRLVFSGRSGGPYTAMAASFIVLVPIVIAMTTVYVAERQERRSYRYYFWAPFLSNALCVVGTLLIMIEGLICAILIVPLFGLLGGIAGLAMGAVCRMTNRPKQVLYSFAALPLLLGGVENHIPLPERIERIERSVLVSATPAQVWHHLENARDIAPSEIKHAWMYRIGVPLPQAGITAVTPAGRVRHITMGKGIQFDQVAIAWEPARHVRWKYRFDEQSFPPRALDDHVVIGGHYFDLVDTAYTLVPRGDKTELQIQMNYRVSTRFNWYAAPIAGFLIGNFSDVILQFYARRAEADADRTRA